MLCEREDCFKKVSLFGLPTRWNSTYLMLELAVVFPGAFKQLEDEDRVFASIEEHNGCGGPPKSEDWNQA